MASVTYEYQLRNPEPEIRESSLGVPNQPSVSTLANGDIILSYDTTFGQNLDLVVYGPDGDDIDNGHVVVDTTTDDSVFGSDVAGLKAGDAVVVWTDRSGATPQVRGTLLGADGSAVENFSVGTGVNDSFAQVAALKDGGFVVAYQHTFVSPTNGLENDIKVEIRGTDGVLRTTLTVDASIANDHNVAVTGLQNGNFVVSFVRDDGDGTTSIFQKLYSATGAELTGASLVDSSGALNLEPNVVALNDGGYAIAYSDSLANGATEIGVLYYTADGNPRGGVIKANIGMEAGNQVHPQMTVLQNGYVMVAWENQADHTTGISVIDDKGVVVLKPLTIFDTQEHVTETVLQALSNGDVAAIGTGHGDFNQTVIEGQLGHIIRNTFGDQSNETLTGDALQDLIVGNGGDDVLSGLGGSDSLSGDAGNDRLIGGAGGDHMSGGTGDDVYVVDNIGDQVIERANDSGVDTVLTSIASNSTASPS